MAIVYSTGASMFFVIAFAIVSILHLFLMLWKRWWSMLWVIVGGILIISGYASSSSAAHGAQSVQVVIAPIFIVATIYICFPRVLKRLNANHFSPMKNWIEAPLFITADVIALGLQIAGLVLQIMGDDRETVGKVISIIGFIFQLVFFLLFAWIVNTVHRKLRRNRESFHTNAKIQWPRFIHGMYLIIILLLIRNIFRIVEYAEGWGGYIFNHAVFVYIFDSTPVLIVTIVLLCVHPGFVVPSESQKLKEPTPTNEFQRTEL